MQDFVNGHYVFAGAFVARSGYRRQDAAWLKSALAAEDTVFVPVWGDKCLAAGEPLRPALLSRADIEPWLREPHAIFLGMYRGPPAFAVGIDGGSEVPFEP